MKQLNIKEKFNNYLKVRKENKIKYKKMRQEEKELDEEVKRELNEKSDLSYLIYDIFNIIRNKDEDAEELEALLTDEEKERLLQDKRENKRILIIALSVIGVVLIIATIGITLYYNENKSDLLKITEPLIKNHLKDNYGIKDNNITMEEITYKDNSNEINTGLVYTTTKNNNHIITLNNSLIGDSIHTSSIKEEFYLKIKDLLGEESVLAQNVEFAYQDYYSYEDFNKYDFYKNVLPYGKSLDELINENKKLTVVYELIYHNEINIDNLVNLYNELNGSSEFNLIKLDSIGLPSSLTIIDKNGFNTFNIIQNINKDNDIIYYELDRNVNGVSDFNIKKISDGSINGDYSINNIYEILIECERPNRDEAEKPHYYLLKMNKSLFFENNTQIGDRDQKTGYYKEIEIDNYKSLNYILIGDNYYIIGTDSLTFGNKTEKSFMCKIGMC